MALRGRRITIECLRYPARGNGSASARRISLLAEPRFEPLAGDLFWQTTVLLQECLSRPELATIFSEPQRAFAP